MKSTFPLLFLAQMCSFLSTQVPLGANGAKILGIFHPPAPSHYFIGSTLMKALAKRGHEVTMISAFENKEKMANWKDVTMTGIREIGEKMNEQMLALPEQSILTQIHHVFNMGPWMAELAINNTNIEKLLKSNEKFDLLIMEAFMNEFHLGLAHRFNCPVVIMSPVGSNIWVNHYIGNPAPSSYVPELLLDNAGKMSFLERLKNGLAGTLMSLYNEFVNIPYQNKLLHKYFPDAPYIKELFKKVSLVLLNSHISVNQAKPHLPNMIEIGGFHVSEPKELPNDLKAYLDSCKNGFVLFSLGSNFKSTFLKPEVKNVLMEAFSKLPYQILWKYEEDLPGKPKNVRIEKWLPQNDVLAHPNLKLFITHGGLLSTTEAVYHGVPIVGIPIFGDQKMNMATSVGSGIGLGLDFRKLEINSFVNTVKKVIDDPKYRQNVKKRSAIMRDRPLKPTEEAVFWVEHIMRHKGGEHFKTSALDLNYFELYQIDVILFLVIVIALSLYIFYKVVKFCCCRSKSQKMDKRDHLKKRN